jgi:hypothetical protein
MASASQRNIRWIIEESGQVTTECPAEFAHVCGCFSNRDGSAVLVSATPDNKIKVIQIKAIELDLSASFNLDPQSSPDSEYHDARQSP